MSSPLTFRGVLSPHSLVREQYAIKFNPPPLSQTSPPGPLFTSTINPYSHSLPLSLSPHIHSFRHSCHNRLRHPDKTYMGLDMSVSEDKTTDYCSKNKACQRNTDTPTHTHTGHNYTMTVWGVKLSRAIRDMGGPLLKV